MNLIKSPRIPVAADDDGLALIGRTLHDLRGIRYRQGEGGNGGVAPVEHPTPAAPGGAAPAAPATPAAPGAPTPAAPEAPTPGAPAAPAAPATAADLPAINPRTGQPFTAAESQARIAELNAEAKGYRERAEAAETAKAEADARAAAILKAAGFNPDGTPYTEVDPAALTTRLTEQQTAAETATRENLVLRVGGTVEHNANVDALLDSREFTNRLAAIGTTDRAGVEALVDEFVQKDKARYGSTPLPAAASGGATHTGTPNTAARKGRSEAFAERFAGRKASPGTAAQ